MFLQIGDMAVNVNQIESVWFDHESTKVTVFTLLPARKEEDFIIFEGADYRVFLNWWVHKAEVYKP